MLQMGKITRSAVTVDQCPARVMLTVLDSLSTVTCRRFSVSHTLKRSSPASESAPVCNIDDTDNDDKPITIIGLLRSVDDDGR